LRKGLLAVAVASVLAGLVVAAAGAAGRTTVEQFSDGPFPDTICGISGTTTVHGTDVFRDNGDGTFFASGTFFGVFTADNGKSITISSAGPVTGTSEPLIDEQAGTVTLVTTFKGLAERLSITHGPTLSLDVGTVTFTDVFVYTGNPDDPIGDFISTDVSFLHGPHPEVDSDFQASCDVLVPYLQDP
jgi:hypothetical protein